MKDYGFCKPIIQRFTESYPSNAIKSLDALSKDISLSNSKGFSAIDIDKTFDIFKEYVTGFVEYKIKYDGCDNVVPNEIITEKTEKFIEKTMDLENIIINKPFKESINYVNNYLHRLDDLNTFINDEIEKINEADLSEYTTESIGLLMNYFDKFTLLTENAVNNTIDELLYCSRYNRKPPTKLKSDDFFL